MERSMHYGTVTEAIEAYRKQGFTKDFNLKENCLECGDTKHSAEDFHIVDVYRYEGASDPGDEAAVYAIEAKDGTKGILVTGYGANSEEVPPSILKKLNRDG